MSRQDPVRRRGHPWILALLLLAPASALPHEGHDHAAPEPVSADPNLVVRSASNEIYEVVLKYHSLAGEASTTARVFLSDYATNKPIENAVVHLRTTAPREVSAAAKAASPGVYEAIVPYEQAGRYTLILAIGVSSKAEFAFQDLPMGEKLAPEGNPAGAVPRPRGWWLLGGVVAALLAAVAVAVRRRLMRPISRTALILVLTGCGAALAGRLAVAQDRRTESASNPAPIAPHRLYMPKESQFLLGVHTVIGRPESLRRRLHAVGHVVPESGALASVEAPRDGKLEQVSRLGVGDRVRQGQVIANLLVIDRLPIRAPISGLVAEVSFTSGQWVQAGDPLIMILDERRIRVELPLFGENLNLALRTRDATVTSNALPGMLFPARVRGLAPTAPEPSGEAKGGAAAGSPIPPLLLTVNNRGGLLRPGMLVEVSLELPTAEELIAVPESAVIRQESGAAVFVHTSAEVFEKRAVRVMGRYGDRVGLTGEVRSGDRIVVEGAQALVSAPPVTVASTPDSIQARR